MEKEKFYSVAYTHAGTFHCDDVFATALIELINPDIKVKRIHNISEIKEKNALIYDIGYGKFDHHQKGKLEREDGTPYASFGLLWKEYGKLLIPYEKSRNDFDEQFVKGLDKSDNYGFYNSLSDAIGSYNYSVDKEDNEVNFKLAVKTAKEILNNKINKFLEIRELKKKMETEVGSDQKYLELKKYLPPAVFADTSVKAVLYPSDRDGYHVQVVKKSFTPPVECFDMDYMKTKFKSMIHIQEKYLFVFGDIEDARAFLKFIV